MRPTLLLSLVLTTLAPLGCGYDKIHKDPLVPPIATTPVATPASYSREPEPVSPMLADNRATPIAPGNQAADPPKRTLADKIEDPRTPQELLDVGAKPVEVVPAPIAPAEIIALTDNQIVKVAQTANQGEIEEAKLAQSRATSPSVRRFAKMMTRHHGNAQRQAMRVATKVKPTETPATSPPAEELKQDGEKTIAALRDKSGAEFDRAYVDAQIKQHENVLKLIDQRLDPEAKDPNVKALVKEMRPIVQQHLQEARTLQKKLEE